MGLCMTGIDVFLRRISVRIALVGVGLLLLMAFLILADALGRWLFSTPIHGLEDVNGLMIVIIVASFFPAILIGRQNIRAAIAGRFLKSSVAGWFDVFGHFVLFIFFVIIAYQFSNYTIQMREQTTLILLLPTAPAMVMSAALIALSALIQGFVLVSEITKLLTRKTAT